MGYTSPTKIARIITLREQGKTIHDIAERVGKDPSTVSRLAREYPKCPDFYSVKVKTGRPRKMTEADTRYCARALAKVEVKTAADVQRKIFPVVSAQTIRRALVNYGLFAYRRRRKPLLTAAHVKKRHNWAQEHKKDDVGAWKKVLFSDESKFNLVASDGVQWCYRRPHETYDPRYVKKMVKHGGGNVMVWGVITPSGVGRLHRVDGNMDAHQYTKILKTSLLGTLKDRKIKKKDIIFQQDNDPKHTSKMATNWFKTNRVKVLEWPPASPDMSIIEPVWDHLDQNVRARPRQPRNKDELWAALEEEWYDIKPEYIKNLYDSMPRRTQALLAAKGGHTKY